MTLKIKKFRTMSDSQKKHILRRRWRWGETRYELSVRGDEIFVDTFPANLKEMRKFWRHYGYISTRYIRSFENDEVAERFAKEINPAKFDSLESLGFEAATELIVN